MTTKSGTNPFLDDDEITDEEFLNHPVQGSSGYIFGGDGGNGSSEIENVNARQRYLLEERRRIEERTLQSTNTSLGLLHESEQVGVATAEELMKQREQLENVERNLDDITSTMRISQKHINSIKSMFGGIKTFFKKGSVSEPTKSASVPAPTCSQSGALQDTIGSLKNTENDFPDMPHAALRTRGIEYEDEFDFGQPVPAPLSLPKLNPAVGFEQKLDRNLEDISMGIGRLKNLAIGLHDEIEDQNVMLDRINIHVDNADETLDYQNRQIKRILKK